MGYCDEGAAHRFHIVGCEARREVLLVYHLLPPLVMQAAEETAEVGVVLVHVLPGFVQPSTQCGGLKKATGDALPVEGPRLGWRRGA